MQKKLSDLKEEFSNTLKNIDHSVDMAELKANFVGKSGKLNHLLKDIKNLPKDVKSSVGQEANKLKGYFLEEIDLLQSKIEERAILQKLEKERIDISLRDSILKNKQQKAGFHPVTLIRYEMEDIFRSLGFAILDGPHIEDDFHNFEALNIPKQHPAREMQDTFWFTDMEHLLRTHTSSVQVRGMKAHKPPFKFVAPGKVFRNEATDASHEAVFHQMEGMLIDKDISVANLIYFIKMLLKEVFHKEIEVRLRPGYFPFVEPGFELDMSCLICSGKGCSVCKQTGWVELCPCGMVHPKVLLAGNIDPNEYNGFAFGLGLDRLVMMLYGINDIRLLHSGWLKFSEQFASY